MASLNNFHIKATPASVITGVVFFLFVPVLLVLIRRSRHKNKSSLLEKKQHVVITGGSSGIGLSIARECIGIKKNDGEPMLSHITLIARDKLKLESAQKELNSQIDTCYGKEKNKIRIQIVSADISKYEVISKAIDSEVIPNSPPPTVLFNVAGTAIPCRFLDADPTVFPHLMSTNYLGSVYTTRALVPHMIQNGGGTVVLTSSAAGQAGIYGYSAYAPTKFALRGLAEVLSMELAPYDIHVQLVFPPNTDTPGFELENKLKMEECKLMEDAAGLYQPEEIAKKMVQEALYHNTRFLVYFGLEGWMLSALTCGFSAVHNLFDAICQIFFMSLFRLISLFYLKNFRGIVDSCHKKRTSGDEKKKK